MTDFIDSSPLSSEPGGIQPQFRQKQPLDNRKRSVFKTIMLLVLLLVILAAGSLIYLKIKVSQPFRENAPAQSFVIVPGQSMRSISSSLRDHGLISNATIFLVYSKTRGDAKRVIAGQYLLSPSMSMAEIMDILAKAKVQNSVAVVRIKEGARLDEIAADLDQQHIVAKEEFMAAATQALAKYTFIGESVHPKSLEGYIFPDTYFIAKPVKASDLISKALANFDKKMDTKLSADIYAQNKTIFQVIIMASILEREAGRNTAQLTSSEKQQVDQERKIIAGVFYNRLRLGIALQSDATITYLTHKHNASATYAETQIDSPYNTYKYKGLPPGPIGNPSLSAIMAATYPAQTDYLYFLSKPDGTMVFAKTLEEQNRNKQLYLK